jgi:hypothetical protein
VEELRAEFELTRVFSASSMVLFLWQSSLVNNSMVELQQIGGRNEPHIQRHSWSPTFDAIQRVECVLRVPHLSSSSSRKVRLFDLFVVLLCLPALGSREHWQQPLP